MTQRSSDDSIGVTAQARVQDHVGQVEEAAAYIADIAGPRRRIGVVLGTGLGALGRAIDVSHTIDYADIPHFAHSTVESHAGRLLIGQLDGASVIAMQGRFHLYEGYDPLQVTLPIRAMHACGVRQIVISNAAGGMNPHFRRGDLMMITDHINLQGVNPLVGPNNSEWGPRFPDMSEPYDRDMRDAVESAALRRGIKLHQGVYAAVVGPNLETRAEYRYLRSIGADAVGMSTVPEVIVARHMDMAVAAISVITDECFPDALEPVKIEEIFAAAATAEPNLTALMKDLVGYCAAHPR